MLRLAFVTVALAVVTAVLIPLQALQLALRLRSGVWLPVAYHRLACALIGVRIHVVGAPARGLPLLVVSNHASWLDIPVITATTPAVFVAKSEVATWPLIGLLARLQRSVFVDRKRRQQTPQAVDGIARALREGDPVVLFAEGTSNDGNHVLPFRSALLGAAGQALCGPAPGVEAGCVLLQPLSVAYVGLHGLPLGRQHRNHVAWCGAADLLPHLARVIRGGGIDVVLTWGAPVAYHGEACRKRIARALEAEVRGMTASALRNPPWMTPAQRPA